MLVFAPLLRGGNRPFPLLVLEIAAVAGLVLFAFAALRGGVSSRLPRALVAALALLLLVPLLQRWLYLPVPWWGALPGHAPYAAILDLAGSANGWRPPSIHPRATEYAWLALLPGVSVFLLVSFSSRSRLRRLATVFVGVAVAEAALGMMQVGSGRDSWLHLGNAFGGSAATGTYVNKNHFASLMAMALPMAIALWALEALPPRARSGEAGLAHPRHADRRIAVNIVLAMMLLLLVGGLTLSSSRAGIGSGLLAASLAFMALAWRTGPRRLQAALVATALAGLGMAAYAGLTPVIDRFSPDNLSAGAGGRLELSMASLRAAVDFLPFGSGLGTFADVFRRHQGETLPGFIDHAHNDYAEVLVELGIAGAIIVALGLYAYARRWSELLRARASRSLGYLQVGAGLGMLAMIVHAAFDFNFHIPANALYFAFLAGIFFFTPDADRA
ncbi:MAG TPA: O-antigen ligase family protein [Usitatibacter sp.]|nr:O-antigen ligase family protein [Usitatibacter sp.]